MGNLIHSHNNNKKSSEKQLKWSKYLTKQSELLLNANGFAVYHKVLSNNIMFDNKSLVRRKVD